MIVNFKIIQAFHKIKQTSFVLGLIVLLSSTAAAQSQQLVITQPTSGTVVTPGNQVNVVVEQANGLPWLYFDSGVGLLVKPPFSTSNELGYDPYLFTISIPANASPGTYKLTAVGSHVGSAPVYSASIDLVVPSQGLQSISVPIRPMTLPYVGSTALIGIEATNLQGSVSSLSASLCSFQSASPGIVSVNATGMVTANSIGGTNITVSCQGLSVQVPVTVPANVRGDLNGDGKVDMDDLNILDSFLNTPANGPNDARDLNHDGTINALDARILTTLCTYPRCATHQ